VTGWGSYSNLFQNPNGKNLADGLSGIEILAQSQAAWRGSHQFTGFFLVVK
jgi:hypothetical protein